MRGFYQQLFTGIESHQALGNRIIRQIKAVHAFRQVEHVKELARVLINNPIKEYRLIAQYYLVWSQCRKSHYDAATLERIVEQTRTYKAKALISRAAFEGYKGNMSEALHFYTEALRTKPILPDYIKALTGIATVKSIEGFHASALRDLENLLPLLGHTEPLNYFEVTNSLAVELGEAGRLYEARNISRLVQSSPFIHAYPEWQETARDLKEPTHSLVTVPSVDREAVGVEAKPTPHAGKVERQPRVVPFPELKEAPKPKKPGRVTPQAFGDMTADERTELILAAIKSGTVRESDYVKLVMTLGLLESGPASKVIDLEDEALLNDIVEAWCNMIEPDEFAAVMSALRDCEDDLRRADIIDAMIAIAFKYTHMSMQTEQEWRLSVERKLPEK
jgi:hypothetical protein